MSGKSDKRIATPVHPSKTIHFQKYYAKLPTHQFIEYVGERRCLRIFLDFRADISHSKKKNILNTFFELLPHYALHARIIYIGMIFKPKHKDDLTCNDDRRRILENVVKQLNDVDKPSYAEIHLALHLDYLAFDQITPASAIHGLNSQSWTLAILTDDVQHIERGSKIDRMLKDRFDKGIF